MLPYLIMLIFNSRIVKTLKKDIFVHFSKYIILFPYFVQQPSYSPFSVKMLRCYLLFLLFRIEAVFFHLLLILFFPLFKRFYRDLQPFVFFLFLFVFFFFSFTFFAEKKIENKKGGKRLPLLLFLIIAFFMEFPLFFVYFKQIYPVLSLFCKMEKERRLFADFPPFFPFSPKHTS